MNWWPLNPEGSLVINGSTPLLVHRPNKSNSDKNVPGLFPEQTVHQKPVKPLVPVALEGSREEINWNQHFSCLRREVEDSESLCVREREENWTSSSERWRLFFVAGFERFELWHQVSLGFKTSTAGHQREPTWRTATTSCPPAVGETTSCPPAAEETE